MAVRTAPGIGHARPAVYVVSVFSSLETAEVSRTETRVGLWSHNSRLCKRHCIARCLWHSLLF